MLKSSIKKYISFICLCLVLLYLLSIILISTHKGHSCHLGNCSVCTVIETINNNIGKLIIPPNLIAFMFNIFAIFYYFNILENEILENLTPISLKVRMNN